jgi:inner membrane protein
MPNAFAHRLGAGLAVGSVVAYRESQEGEITGKSLISGVGAAACGTLPDLIEPALHPNHRQFFHSFLMLAGVGYGLKKLYDWQPESADGQFWRSVGLVVGGAYAVHLLMDACTKRSLPLI